MTLSSKQRAYLRSLAAKETAIFQIGKDNLTPEVTAAVAEAFHRRELLKLSILKSATQEPRAIGEALADRTGSVLVQIIGRKLVLYKPDPDNPRIVLPR